MENTIKEEIWHTRMHLRLNQSEFAETMCVSRQTISSWENGNSEPSASQMDKIRALKVSE